MKVSTATALVQIYMTDSSCSMSLLHISTIGPNTTSTVASHLWKNNTALSLGAQQSASTQQNLYAGAILDLAHLTRCAMSQSHAATGYEGVMMQAALDMQSGIVLDPMAEFKALGQHPDQGSEPAIGVAGLTLSVKQGNGKAAYAPACTDTDAVGMACEQVTGLCLLCHLSCRTVMLQIAMLGGDGQCTRMHTNFTQPLLSYQNGGCC